MIEHLETQAKNINDVLLTIQKNQTSNHLAKQQMEIIAALNRNNEKTALEKKPKKQAKRKALKEKKNHQETKARWNAKRTKTELAAAADAARGSATNAPYHSKQTKTKSQQTQTKSKQTQTKSK